MNKGMIIAAAISILIAGNVCLAQDAAPEAETADQGHGHGPVHTITCLQCMTKRDTLTDNWFGLGEQLSEQGLTVSLGLTVISQFNHRGGISTHRKAGRFTGSWDLEFEADMEELLGITGGLMYMSVEGSWSDGIDGPSVGSVFGVNGDAAGDDEIAITQLYYDQSLLGGTLIIRVGKLDLSGGFQYRGYPLAFDGNAFANDETAQFLNSALVNNPTIPFPQNGLGAVVYYNPIEWWYIAAGVSDAQAVFDQTGFNTAFHDEDYFFYIAESGVSPLISSANGPLQGAYRAGVWYDPQKKTQYSGGSDKRNDVGFYISADQMVYNENNDQDGQGLGLFARYGYAHSDVNPITNFWSIGAQYQGLIPGRDNDVLGAGIASGKLVQDAGFTEHNETAAEVYYNSQITPWLHITQSAQYICTPGDSAEASALAFALRVQLTF